MEKESVSVSTYHGIAAINFFNPKSNSLSSKLADSITGAIDKFAADSEAKV